MTMPKAWSRFHVLMSDLFDGYSDLRVYAIPQHDPLTAFVKIIFPKAVVNATNFACFYNHSKILGFPVWSDETTHTFIFGLSYPKVNDNEDTDD